MKKPGKFVVWPANLDSTKSRIEGRKIPKGLAVQTPRLEEINEAANRLSLEAELTPGKSRPSLWWDKGGFAILPRKGTRTSLLRALAGDIKRTRAAKSGLNEHNR